LRFDPVILPLLFVLAAGLSIPARPQEPAKALDPAGVIPLRHLQGKTISVVINFANRFRITEYTLTGETTRKLRIGFGENGAFTIRSARENVADGVVHVLRRQFTGMLGQPGKTSEREDYLGIYENNALSFFTVLDVGAASNIITLKRSPEGFTCTAAGPSMQEVGRGPNKTIGRTREEKAEVLSFRQLSSTCKVQVTEQVNDNDGFWTPRRAGRTPANCLRCVAKCDECKTPVGHPCFEKCRAAGNYLVRSDSGCWQKFIPCSAEVK
jgi:hypothetical protein